MELAGSGVQLSFDAEVDAGVIVIKQQLHATIFSANLGGAKQVKPCSPS